jgi:endoglucanase
MTSLKPCVRVRRRAFLAGLVGAASLNWAPLWAAEKSPPRAAGAMEQNKRLGRGVNIIGYDPLWRSRDRARFHDEHFKLIREAGFSNVRINLHPFQYAKADAQGKISPGWFETLDWAVQQALANKLMVILDFHEFTAMGRDPERNRERFLAMWQQIAEHYRDAPGEVLFEILNEPNGKLTPQLWNKLLRDALAVIRRTNPTRTVVIGPGQWNNINALETLQLPEDDRNIILTVHYYSPMQFTHQGASWTGQRDKVGIPWNGSPEDREAIQRDFAKAQAWARKHNRPVFLGEFGAYDKADMASRVRYLRFVTRQAEKLGWSWAYWQFDSDFIVYDMRNKRWIEPIRDALIPSKQ